MERGERNISLDNIYALADALEIEAAALLTSWPEGAKWGFGATTAQRRSLRAPFVARLGHAMLRRVLEPVGGPCKATDRTKSAAQADPSAELWQRAVNDGHLRVDTSGRTQRITYTAVQKTEEFQDPEEKVRANFYAELIYVYGYDPVVIGVEVVVPDRRPSDRADLVVFRDHARTRPFAVIARALSEEGVLSPQGRPAWQSSTVRRIIAAQIKVR